METTRMQDELLAIERQLWSGGAETYRRHVDDQCLLAFVGMAGISTRDEVAATVKDGPRWRELEIDVQGMLMPVDDVAILTYRAQAIRGDDERYIALVSSAYVKRPGGWKLVFHQQTPAE